MKALLFFVCICGFICQGQEIDHLRNDTASSKFNYFLNNPSSTESPASTNSTSKPIYEIIRSSLGLAGTSKIITTQSGQYSVSESIGQRSVVGSFNKNGYTLRQGYQQPPITVKVFIAPDANALEAVFYPNPFLHSLTISINTPISDRINILLFDFTGRLIYNREHPASQLINLQLGNISQGVYIIKVASGSKYISANLIKN
jgi:hypothetical protein